MQRCVRAGGKHNDLDAIGRSPRHLSFFEMLGNFSFGDYFKARGHRLGLGVRHRGARLDPDRLWVTVHVSDDEAEALWADEVGFPRERIQRMGKDNFWEMGDTGPCGPCSEIFWDNGPELGPEGGPANPAAEERYVEIWNLVFPQFLRGADGQLSDLPEEEHRHRRRPRAHPGRAGRQPQPRTTPTSLSALVGEAQSVTGHRLGESELGDIALRLMADHARTMTFLVADGVIPSNEDRGYVLRRIIRRAIRFAYLLGVERPVLPAMVERTVDLMGDAYPEIVESRGLVLPIIDREEESFRRTLATGSQILDAELDKLEPGGTLPGDVAFQLHDTYGFPFEVTQEIADLRGFGVDVAGFDVGHGRPAARARAASRAGGVATGDEVDETSSGCWRSTARPCSPAATSTRPTATVIGVVGDAVYLDRTPFYAESGGQVGDTGTITTDTGVARRGRHHLRPARAAPAHGGGPGRAGRGRPGRDGRASTASAGTPSAATTPAPTSSTGRCARCSATT